MTYKKEMMSLKTVIAIYCPLLSTLRGGGGSYLFQVAYTVSGDLTCNLCVKKREEKTSQWTTRNVIQLQNKVHGWTIDHT